MENTIFFEMKEGCEVSRVKITVWSIGVNLVLNIVLNLVLNSILPEDALYKWKKDELSLSRRSQF